MRKIIAHILLFASLFSCMQKGSVIGHWHEYNNGFRDFENCYIVNDSTISINSTIFGRDGGFLLDTMNVETIYEYSPHFDGTVPDYEIDNDSIVFENNIRWVRQQENPTVYLQDFSAGYKVTIHPFEINKEVEEPIEPRDNRRSIYLPIGKIKPQFENKEAGFFRGNYYFQLNDKLTSNSGDIEEFILCIHCQLDKIDLNVVMDKNTPKETRAKLDSVITFLNLKPEQVHYLLVDPMRRKRIFINSKDLSGF